MSARGPRRAPLVRLGSLALLATLAACGPGPGEQAPTPPRAVAVERVVAARETLVEAVFGTGTLAAVKTSEIGPRVDGIIDAIFAKVGDRVVEGQELFRTRRVDYEIRVREAEHGARLARAEAAKARRDFERARLLHEKGVASSEQLDGARTGREIADARLGAADTALARARQDLDDTVVRAPYAGVITRRYVDEGTMLRTMLSTGATVVQLMQTDVVVAIVQLPELELPRVRVGTRARLRVDGAPRELEGAVAVLNDRVDPLTRAFEVRIPVENPDLSLKPGLFVRTELLPEPREATVVERRAVLGSGDERWVMVADGGRARRRPVAVRDLDATRFEVVRGLAPGDVVLAGPNLPLVGEGTPVTFEVARVER